MASEGSSSASVSSELLSSQVTDAVTTGEAGGAGSVELHAQEIFRTTMSPYCPGLLLSDCPSGKATELKTVIRSELAQGKSVDELRQELAVKYNAQLDARPPTSGFGVLMWAVPLMLLLVGAVLVTRFIRNQVRAQQVRAREQ